MKLDATDLRYITSEEFRVLTAVEMGSKNHEVVPTVLIVQISGLRNGGVNKLIGSLAKRNLVARVQNSKYDGYRLTYGGYDYLAMRALSKRDSMYSVGNQIGVGKESDIYIVANAEGKEMVLKLHRLGRISFRAIKEKRDYMGKRKSASWMYMSRLAAQKEWAFMKVLHEHGFPVPKPIDQARHCILMEFIDAYPLRQIADIPSPGALYSNLMDIIVRFARAGLIHGDYNEFNILVRRETGEPIVIDFPQMVSTSHINAEMYFNRDVECIRTFFRRRFNYESRLYPRFRGTIQEGSEGGGGFRLDVVVAASGFKQSDQRALEEYMEVSKETAASSASEDEEEEEDDEEADDAEGTVFEGQHGEGTDIQSESAAKPDALAMGQSQPLHSHQLLGVGTDIGQDNLHDDNGNDILSPITRSRPISRSPPASRHTSPDRSQSPSLVERTAALSLSPSESVKDRIASQVTKDRARQQRKYHSKRGARDAGRQKGSKAKMDTRIKADRNGVWE